MNAMAAIDSAVRLRPPRGTRRLWTLPLIVLAALSQNGCNPNAVKPDLAAVPAAGGGVFFPAADPADPSASARASANPAPAAGDSAASEAATGAGATAAENPVDIVAPVTAAIPLSQPPRPTTTRSKRALTGQNSLYDRANPAYGQLQKANQALAGFPADNSGQVDWVATLRQGKIKPRSKLRSQGQMEILAQELIMKNTREMPWVRFPHEAHTQWLACTNCHDRIFKPVQGGQKITMDDIFRGRYCGVCHDRVAFSVFTCERCHSVVHPNSPKAWWTQ